MNTNISGSNTEKKGYKFTLDGKPYEFGKYITGNELREIANVGSDFIIFLKVEGLDEEVHDSEKVDLARIGIEHFYTVSRHPTFKFKLNGTMYEWQQYITGADLRKLGNIDSDDPLFLKVQGKDEKVGDHERVDLARFGVEHFYSVSEAVQVILIVNGREKSWNEKFITFDQVIDFAFGSHTNDPNWVYTVTYARGPEQNPEGTMVKGNKINVKNKMIFNVTATNKS